MIGAAKLNIVKMMKRFENCFYKVKDRICLCAIQLKQNYKSFLGILGLGWLIAISYIFLDILMPLSDDEYSIRRILIETLWGPILEEVVFRALLFRFFLKFLSTINSALLSSLLFGLIHYPYPSIIGPTLFGFYLVAILTKTNSLLLCIALHSINNAMAIGIGLLIDYLASINELIGEICATTWIATAFFLLVWGWRDLVGLFKFVWYKEAALTIARAPSTQNSIKNQ